MPAINPNPTPVINAFVATSLAQAQSWATAVDASLGLPKPGVEVGGGIHAPDPNTGGPFVTQTYFIILPHPTLAQWAYIADVISTPIVVGVTPTATSTLLDSTWFAAAGPIGTMMSFFRKTFANMAARFR